MSSRKRRQALRAAAEKPEIRTADMATAFMDRMAWMRQVGLTFDGARDMYKVLGYTRQITTLQYLERYRRGGIAKAIIEVYPNATWRGSMELTEDKDPHTDTAFEKAWKDLDQRLQIQAKLRRADTLSRLSTYAVILIGAPGNFNEELPKGSPDDLLYLTPFLGGGGPNGDAATRTVVNDAQASIQTIDTNVESERFGLPLTYQVKRVDASNPMQAKEVHWTRIIHIAENCLLDDIYGQPAMEAVFNLLDDLDKVTGGGAEAFWLRAAQGLHINIDKDLALSDAKSAMPALREQVDEYRHGLSDRVFRTRGTDIKMLGSDVANFESPADAIVTQIAGTLRIPKRILMGSEMGQLASSEDRDNWKDQVNGRQTSYVGPYIVRPLVNRLIDYGYLPAPKGGTMAYEVKWPHIQTLTEDDKSKGALSWAQTNAAQGKTVYTTDEIREKWEGMAPLEPNQIEVIGQQQQDPNAKKDAVPAPKTAEANEDAELLRVLESAVVAGATDVIERIIGIPLTRESLSA